MSYPSSKTSNGMHFLQIKCEITIMVLHLDIICCSAHGLLCFYDCFLTTKTFQSWSFAFLFSAWNVFPPETHGICCFCSFKSFISPGVSMHLLLQTFSTILSNSLFYLKIYHFVNYIISLFFMLLISLAISPILPSE